MGVWICVATVPAAQAQAAKGQVAGLDEVVKIAEKEFRLQKFKAVIRVLQPWVAEGRIPDPVLRLKLVERVAASYWLTDQVEKSRSAFTVLWKINLDHALDVLVYPPELVEFYRAERARLVTLGLIGPGKDPPPKGPDPTGQESTLVTKTITLRQTPGLAYAMPFAVGQFANGESGLGTVLAVLQTIGLVGNVATWISVESLKVKGKIAPAQVGQADLLQGIWLGSTALFAAAYLYSVIDGPLNRPPRRSEATTATPPVTTLRLVPATGGLGLGVFGRF